ncbi:hypothetical protein B0G73_107227 [Paraburkholderia sp. BL25I1N1]|nr:hypothetical protein B0G73_107227 [Paraburkholderia sp. BL25I1N1]
MRIEMLQLFRVRSVGFEVEHIFERAARHMETLKSVEDANLKDNAITIVRHRCPNERIATHGAPVDQVGSIIRQFMFAYLGERRIFSKL